MGRTGPPKDTFVMHNAVACTTDDQDYNSPELNCVTPTKFLLEYAITETGVLVNGDRLIIQVEFSDDGVTWYAYQNGPFGYLVEEESTTPCNKSVSGDCIGERMRVTATTDYTNVTPANNYFTITSKVTLME